MHKEKLNAVNVLINSEFSEHIWAKIKLNSQDCLLLGCLYRSPSSSTENFVNLTNLLEHVRTLRPPHFLRMGDLNFKQINWVDQSTTGNEEHIATLFLDCVRHNYFYQYVKDYTRFRDHNAPSVLDLILSYEENMISEMKVLPSLGKSDHLVILFDFNCFIQPEPDITFKKLNFSKGDYKSITSELSSIDWSSKINDLNLNLSWSFLVDVYEVARNRTTLELRITGLLVSRPYQANY